MKGTSLLNSLLATIAGVCVHFHWYGAATFFALSIFISIEEQIVNTIKKKS